MRERRSSGGVVEAGAAFEGSERAALVGEGRMCEVDAEGVNFCPCPGREEEEEEEEAETAAVAAAMALAMLSLTALVLASVDWAAVWLKLEGGEARIGENAGAWAGA
jgi:hypothetical protein